MMQVVATTGDKVKQLRLEMAWTQVELANKAGVSPSTVVLIENGETKPHVSTRRKLAEALEAAPRDLLDD